MTRPRRSDLSIVAALATTLALSSCGGGGGSSGPITVSGIVIAGDGAPIDGVSILLNDDGATLATTGADGKFSYAHVTPPYSLTAQTGGSLVELRGLSRSAPTIFFDSGGGSTANLSGSVTGPTYPLGANEFILLGATGGVLAQALSGVDPTTGDYSTVNFFWTGTAPRTADVAALQIGATGTLITSYSSTGKHSSVTLQGGVDQTGIDIALTSPVTTKHTVLNFDAGAYSASVQSSYLMLESRGAKYFLDTGTIPTGTSVLLPDGGGTFLIQGSDVDGNGALRIGTANLGGTTTLNLPAATALANGSPADGATGLSTTPTLSWTAVSGAKLYLVNVSGPSLDYEFVLPGSEPSLTLPDFSTLGLSLAGATSYDWSVTAIVSGSMSPNTFVDPAKGGLEFSLFTASSATLYETAETSFTTAP